MSGLVVILTILRAATPSCHGSETAASEVARSQASVAFEPDENSLQGILDGQGISVGSTDDGLKGPRLTLGGKLALTAAELGITEEELVGPLLIVIVPGRVRER